MDFTFEELTMNALPSLQTVLLNGWIIRLADGYLQRANSVIPIYSFDKDLDDKISYCENIYRNNNLPTIFKIIECEEHKNIDKKLEELRYEKVDLTSVQICNNIMEKKINLDQIVIENEFTENWKNCFNFCHKINNKKIIEIKNNILKNIKHKIISVNKLVNGTFIGCGYGIIDKGFVGLYDIVVNEEFRGKGYGKEIVEAILTKAKDMGIKKAYLAVVDNNEIAKELYSKMGFKEIYKYWYRNKV